MHNWRIYLDNVVHTLDKKKKYNAEVMSWNNLFEINTF